MKLFPIGEDDTDKLIEVHKVVKINFEGKG